MFYRGLFVPTDGAYRYYEQDTDTPISEAAIREYIGATGSDELIISRLGDSFDEDVLMWSCADTDFNATATLAADICDGEKGVGILYGDVFITGGQLPGRLVALIPNHLYADIALALEECCNDCACYYPNNNDNTVCMARDGVCILQDDPIVFS